MSWWSDLWRTKADEWWHGWIEKSNLPDGPKRGAVPPDKQYLTMTLRSLHIPFARKGLTKYYGAVHCFTGLSHNQKGSAEFHALTAPTKLAGVDANVSAVVTTNKTLLGPVPYRGGKLAVEIGLFSVAAGNLAGPYLEMLEGLADTVGVSFINHATDVTAQLVKGIDRITREGKDSSLEIGLAAELDGNTGCYAVIHKPRDVIEKEKDSLMVAADGRLVDGTGRLIPEAHLVFSLEARGDRPDWRRIPELLTAYDKLKDPVERGEVNDAKALLLAFKRALRFSPDLVREDGDAIYAKVEQEISDLLPSTATASKKVRFPSLDELHVSFGR